MHNLINRRIAKFCKQTMALTLALLFVMPSIMYSMSTGFKSAKAASSYETVGVGKTLVECFPGEDKVLAKYVYQSVLEKSDWDEGYKLTEEDVSAITGLDYVYLFITEENKSVDISGISNFTNLVELEFDFDDASFVTEVTDEIASLTKLTNLDLCGVDSLPKLPSSLTDLSLRNVSTSVFDDIPDSLTSLGINYSNITSLPDNLPGSLTSLDVSTNQLKSLPNNLPDTLTFLEVSDNQLKSLPELPAGLTELYANENQLTSLPELPTSLTRLEVQNNQLKELDLANMASLSSVNIDGQTPQFAYTLTQDGNYKILDVPTKNLSDIEINGEAYNDYDNSGSITVSSLPTSFTYNYNTGYNNTKMDVTAQSFTETSLNSISVKTPPTKTTYIEGEKFDPTGLVITLHYDNDITEDVTYSESNTDFKFSPDLEDNLKADIKKVTITYAGKSVDQDISVKVFIDDKTLTDEKNGVTISGSFEENTSLTITEITSNDDNYSTLIESLGDGKKVLLAVDVSLANGSFKPGSSMTLTFEVDPIYNGKTATIKHLLSNGQIETYTATVIDGKIQITVTELSPFIIAIDEDPVSTDDSNGSYYATGDNAPITALFAIIAGSVMIISGYIIINRKKFLQK